MQEEKYKEIEKKRLSGNEYYQGSIKIVAPLVKKYGTDNTIKIMKSLDWKACDKIDFDSPEYARILENPELLPGFKEPSV
jgi:hypothetical protein